jgi:hypothetical protein
MNQALYAHMNNKRKMKKKFIEPLGSLHFSVFILCSNKKKVAFFFKTMMSMPHGSLLPSSKISLCYFSLFQAMACNFPLALQPPPCNLHLTNFLAGS